MEEPQAQDMGAQISREGTAGGAVELQLQMPGLGMGFGLELMRQRAEQLEKLPDLSMEGQL